jgi:hypothetical protein
LTLGDGSNQPLPALGEPNYRRGRAATLLIRYDYRLATFHNRDDGVGGSQIDANDLAHIMRILPSFFPRICGFDLA